MDYLNISHAELRLVDNIIDIMNINMEGRNHSLFSGENYMSTWQ